MFLNTLIHSNDNFAKGSWEVSISIMFINQQLKKYFPIGQHFDRVYYSLQLEFVSFLGNFRNTFCVLFE